jgi:hypothetical protein
MKKVFLLLAALLMSQNAFGQCTTTAASFTGGTFAGTGGLGYDPFDPTTYTQTVTLSGTIFHTNQCYPTVGVGKSTATASYTPRSLLSSSFIYNVKVPSGPAAGAPHMDYPDAGLTSNMTFFIPGFDHGGVTTHAFSTTILVSIPPMQTFTPTGTGLHCDTMPVRLHNASVLGAYINTFYTTSLNFCAQVQKKLDLSVVADGGTFNISNTSYTVDFVDIDPGETQTADVVVRRNTGYSLAAVSLNASKLKHATYTDTIPYTVEINGVAASLAAPLTVANIGAGWKTPDYNRYKFKFIAPAASVLDTKPMGTYNDTITFTLTAL